MLYCTQAFGTKKDIIIGTTYVVIFFTSNSDDNDSYGDEQGAHEAHPDGGQVAALGGEVALDGGQVLAGQIALEREKYIFLEHCIFVITWW